MALATQCPHCHTTFRVAHDQLKLRAGLVRCGACKQIFNGIENLLRLDDRPPAPPASAPGPEAPQQEEPQAAATPTAAGDSRPPETPIGADVDFYLPPEDEEEDSAATRQAEQPVADVGEADKARRQAESLTDEQTQEFPPGEEGPREEEDPPGEEASLGEEATQENEENLPPPAPEDPLLRMTLLDVSETGAALVQSDADGRPDPLDLVMDELQRKPLRNAADEAEAEDEPSFVRQGRRRQRLGRAARTSMAVVSALLLLALLAQAAYVFRDQLAARVPQAKPVLQLACTWLECQVGLPAQIDAIALESSELQTLAPDSETLALTALLRNQSAVAQAWPHLELTLNDAAEKPVVRRVFSPAEYLPPEVNPRLGIAARSEQPVRLFFELEGTKASGYRVYLFHP